MVMNYSLKINEDSKSKIEIFGDQRTGLMLRSNISYLSIRRKLQVFSQKFKFSPKLNLNIERFYASRFVRSERTPLGSRNKTKSRFSGITLNST